MDSYFKDIDDSSLPRGRNGEPFFDHPGAYHLDEVQRDVLALIGGSSIALPNYNMDQNKRLPGNGGILLPTPTVIVDGLFAIDLDFGQEINTLSVYIDAPPETRLRRRIDRDEEKYGVPKKVVSEAFWSRIEPQSRLYIEPQKDCADIVVRSEEGCSCL
jgi:uridine kinase